VRDGVPVKERSSVLQERRQRAADARVGRVAARLRVGQQQDLSVYAVETTGGAGGLRGGEEDSRV
jgi:hypothetical protein